jgi:Uma2 family endonuclease
MPVSEKTYLRVALEDPGQWELHCGHLRRKPGMTAEHNEVAYELGLRLGTQLDRSRYHVRVSMGHVRRSSESYYIPDVFVIPNELFQRARGRPNSLETYTAPLPLVIEVWSPSTGDYDVDSKLPEYQARGDLEIWRVHPFDRTLTAWRRQADGSYSMSEYAGGVVQPVPLPGVATDLDNLFN